MLRFLGLVFIFMCMPIKAAEWRMDFSAKPTFNYNDNETFSNEKNADSSWRVTPTVFLSRNLENHGLELSAGYNVSRYDKRTDLDREDPFLTLNSNYRSERFSFGLNGRYSQQDRREFAEEDNGDFTDTTTVIRRSLIPSMSYNLTELDTVNTSLRYSETSAPDSDSTVHGINLDWSRTLTERLSGGLTASYTKNEFDSDFDGNDSESKTYNLSLTSKYSLSEIWSLSGSLGRRRLENDNSNSRGETYQFQFNRNGENSQFSWVSSLNVSLTSTGDLTERLSHRISYSKPLTEKLSSSVNVGYTEFRSPNDKNDKRTETFSITPSLNWQVTERLNLNFNYAFREVKDFDVDAKKQSNAFSVTITYPFQGYSISR